MTKPDEYLDRICDAYDLMNETRIRHIMRKFNMKSRRDASIHLIKLCVAIEDVLGAGMITIAMLESLTPTKYYTSILRILHNLGDYGILNQIKERKRSLRYSLTDVFKESLEPDEDSLIHDYNYEAYWETWHNRNKPIKLIIESP